MPTPTAVPESGAPQNASDASAVRATPAAQSTVISLDSDDDGDGECDQRRDDPVANAPGGAPLYADDDVTIEGERGCVAGRDLPHLRHDCLVVPCDRSGFVFPSLSVPRQQSHGCAKCYCPVCDVPTSECTHRVSHHTIMCMLMPTRHGGSVEMMRSLLDSFSFSSDKKHTLRCMMQHVTDPQHSMARMVAKYNTWYTRL